jgi:putative nucleotidyltransferase with HDIG domain
MNRRQAEELLDRYVTSEWLKKHSLATAAVMEALARRFGQDLDTWWTMGLLHDIDFDITQDPAEHGARGAEILRQHGFGEDFIAAVMAHNAEGLGLKREKIVDYALTCGESITGLVVATALVMPDKKLSSVKPSSVVKRMRKKDFARKVSREAIMLCEEIDLPVVELAELAVSAMQSIAADLGL